MTGCVSVTTPCRRHHRGWSTGFIVVTTYRRVGYRCQRCAPALPMLAQAVLFVAHLAKRGAALDMHSTDLA
jgi:hypothetical protein